MNGVRVGSKNDITMPATKVIVAKNKKKRSMYILCIGCYNGQHSVGLRIGGGGCGLI